MSVTTIALETTVVPVTVVTPIPVTVTTIYSVPFATSTITSTSTAPSSSASSMPTSVPNPPLPESAIVGLYVPAVVLGSLFGLFTYVKNSVEANHLKKFPKRMYILMSAISIVFSFVASVLSSQHFSDPLLTVIWSRHFNLATDIVTVLGCLAALRAFWKGGSVRMDGSQGMWKGSAFVVFPIFAAITGLASSAFSVVPVPTLFTHWWVGLLCWFVGLGFFFVEVDIDRWTYFVQ